MPFRLYSPLILSYGWFGLIWLLQNNWIKAGLLILAVFSFVYMFNMSTIP